MDADAYLLQLSRYIHRNPIEVKGVDSDSLLQHPWSSYLAYINKAKPEPWLAREKIYAMMGHKQRYVGYRTYVDAGVDEDIKRFYNKGTYSGYWGPESSEITYSKTARSMKLRANYRNSCLNGSMPRRLWMRCQRFSTCVVNRSKSRFLVADMRMSREN